jgi:predicted secreted Zn-dependent protease
VTFLFTITLPRWSPPKHPDGITVAWWNAELARAATHEKHHVDLWRAAAKRMSAAVATSSCATLPSQLGAIVREAARANCEFDLDAYGRELGLTLESCLNQ